MIFLIFRPLSTQEVFDVTMHCESWRVFFDAEGLEFLISVMIFSYFYPKLTIVDLYNVDKA